MTVRHTPTTRAGGDAARVPSPPRALRRVLALGAALGIALFGAAAPLAASAAPNPGIVVSNVVIEDGGTQATVGDTLFLTGEWDATQAAPLAAGDTFSIGLPPELELAPGTTFALEGADDEVWGVCAQGPDARTLVCELTELVETTPFDVQGTFGFEIVAVGATDEESLEFDLNGEPASVELPGGGGIDDGLEPPTPFTKSGGMNANRWSMGWTIDLPGDRLVGSPAVNIAEQLNTTHQLCDPSGLRIEQRIGGDAVDITAGVAEIVDGDTPQDYTIRLTEPAGGWDARATYRVTYNTCTPDGEIDPVGTQYENEATVDIWNESSGVIGVGQNWQISQSIGKTGSILGGAARNGEIRWTITVPGSDLVGKDSFTLTDAVTGPHEVRAGTISGISVVERYGPSSEQQQNITSLLDIQDVSSGLTGFTAGFTIDDDDFAFKPSDHMYLISYTTYATTDGLPASGTAFGNTAVIEGRDYANTQTVPARTDQKRGGINATAVTLDGVEHMPQTTLNWTITVPGEKLADWAGNVVVTDTLSATQTVCEAGDPSGGVAARLGLTVRAVDQIGNGGLGQVDLTDSVTASVDNQVITLTIPQPTLTVPGTNPPVTAVGFSREYQYVIAYTTCTASGGMDAVGTSYGNEATVNGAEYGHSVTQERRSSGTGRGVARGSIDVSKLIADTPGADLVPDGTMFTVHLQEFAPGGEQPYEEYDLQVPLNGDPVSGLNARGTGWTIVLSEPTFPSVPGVVFGDPVFSGGDGVTVSADGTVATVAATPATNIAVSLENTALLGSLSVLKEVRGGAEDNAFDYVDPEQEFTVTAQIAVPQGVAAQPDRTFTIKDGQTVTLEDLPVGATVTLSEAVPAPGEKLTWSAATFTGNSAIVPAPGTDAPVVTVGITNTVQRTLGTVCVAKVVTGDEAGSPDVPESVEVTASWQQEDQEEIQRTVLSIPTDPEAPCTPLGEDLYIGTAVTLVETPLADGSGIAWEIPRWSGTGIDTGDDDQVVGDSVVVNIGRDAEALVTLENPTVSLLDLALLKRFGGAAAAEVPGSTVFPVTVSWTDLRGVPQQRPIGITTGAPTVVEGIPAGVEVTVVENRAELPARIAWTGVAWSSTDEGAELSPDGARVVLTLAGEGGSTVSVTATNSFEVLALTGSEGGPWLLAIGAGAMVLIGGGALALIRRRMAAGTE